MLRPAVIHTVLLAALAGLSIAAFPAAARADCPSAPLPRFSIRVDQPAAIYDFAATRETFAAAAGEIGSAFGHDRRLFGLTVNRYEITIASSAERRADGCAASPAIDIILHSHPRVLIDGSFGPGSCQRQAIFDHENQHVAVFRRSLDDAAPALAAALTTIAVPALPPREAELAFDDTVHAQLEAALDTARRHADIDNGRLDSSTSYAEVFHRCHTW